MKVLGPVTAVAGAAAVAVAFMAGAVAYSKQTWPFGSRYEFVDMVLERVTGRLDRALDEYKRTEISSGHHELVVERWPLPFRDWGPTGPFVALSRTEYIVSSRPGEIFHVKLDGPKVTLTSMGKIAVNENSDPRAGLKGFLLTAPDTLLLSLTTFHADRNCYSMELHEASVDVAAKKFAVKRRIMEVQPCVAPESGLDLAESGGRILPFGDGQVLLSTGTLGKRAGGQHGKILKVTLKDGSATEYATGFRNPQGLFVDTKTGEMFETEHGPRGGDELNLVKEGVDYGWPKVSYGTSYEGPEAKTPQPTDQWAGHEGFQKPLISFTPAIGIGQLIRYPADGADAAEFPRWRGDLLVGSLRGQALYRMRYAEGRIVFAEPIALEDRIRDIALLPGGAIALKTDTPRLIVISHKKPAAAQ